MSADLVPKDDPEFFALIERVRAGSDEAARELLRKYGEYVERAVRSRLHSRMRSRFDSIDFYQEVWSSFFADPQNLERIEGPDALIRQLRTMARNKVAEEFRRLLTGHKNNLNRVRSLDGSAEFEAVSLAAKNPTPSQVAVINEVGSRMISSLPVHYQKIIKLRQQGMTQKEIAAKLRLHVRTVQRVIQRLLPEDGS